MSKNEVAIADLPELIRSVHQALTDLGKGLPPAAEPAVPIKKSVTPDYLICLDDGKKLKMLKRHLRTAYDMSPDEYRAKWGLPSDYPMVAPKYTKLRSELASSSVCVLRVGAVRYTCDTRDVMRIRRTKNDEEPF